MARPPDSIPAADDRPSTERRKVGTGREPWVFAGWGQAERMADLERLFNQ
jgi:hypothetical protein